MKEQKLDESASKNKLNYIFIATSAILLIAFIVVLILAHAIRGAARDANDSAQEYLNYVRLYEQKTGIPRETIADYSTTTEEQKDETPVVEEEQEVVKSDNAVEITSEYIYFPDYGIKLKKPDTIVASSYQYSNVYGYGSVKLWGVKKGTQYFPDFADPNLNRSGVFAISIMKREDYDKIEAHYDVVAYKDDDVVVSYAHPQSVWSTQDADKSVEQSSVNAFMEWAQVDGSFSKI